MFSGSLGTNKKYRRVKNGVKYQYVLADKNNFTVIGCCRFTFLYRIGCVCFLGAEWKKWNTIFQKDSELFFPIITILHYEYSERPLAELFSEIFHLKLYLNSCENRTS